jgi:fatty-acyl-CoA synthase
MARQALAGCPDLRELVFLPDFELEGLDAGVPLGGQELTYAELLKRADAVGHAELKARMAAWIPTIRSTCSTHPEPRASPRVPR